jgi:uncharacterized protein (TIGR03083 family)
LSSGGSLEALSAECGALLQVVGVLSEADLLRPTNCPPWNLRELVVHIADSITVGRGFPRAGEYGVVADAADYYRRPERDTPQYRTGNVQRTREHARVLEATLSPASWLEQTVEHTVTTLSAAELDRVVVVDGVGPMKMDDWVLTRVMSVAAHGIDVALSTGRAPWTTTAALDAVCPVLVRLLGGPLPATLEWDQLALLHAGTGRRPLTATERDQLGPLANRFPLLS